MPTCPNCGEIVMNGDPYCPHCGSTLRWVKNDRGTSGSSIKTRLIDIPIGLFYSHLTALHEPEHIISGIKEKIDISKASNDAVFSMMQDFPGGDIRISFKRQNKYFSTTDYIRYSCAMNKIDGHYFLNDFGNLKNAQWFKDAVGQKELQTGLKFYDCGGGYDARWDWDTTNVFELKTGCEVIVHFIENEYNYKGFVVDFRNHRLKDESKRYDKTTPNDLVKDYDWY